MVIWPRVVLIVGLSMIFVSINVAAFKYIPPHLRGAAVGLFALLRNEGGSVGTSLAQALEWRREHFHTARVGEFLDPLNPAVNSFLQQARAFFFQQTGDPAASQQMALQALDEPPPAAGGFAGLLRRLLALRRSRAGAGPSRFPHEALGGREGGSHWSGVGRQRRRIRLFEGLNAIVEHGVTVMMWCSYFIPCRPKSCPFWRNRVRQRRSIALASPMGQSITFPVAPASFPGSMRAPG